MGQLFYGSDPQPIEMDDRLLQYVQTVAATKMRRGESFTLTWTGGKNTSGRTTLWIQPSIAVRFTYASVEPERMLSGYLRQIADMASASSGIMLNPNNWQEQEAAHAPRMAAVA